MFIPQIIYVYLMFPLTLLWHKLVILRLPQNLQSIYGSLTDGLGQVKVSLWQLDFGKIK